MLPFRNFKVFAVASFVVLPQIIGYFFFRGVPYISAIHALIGECIAAIFLLTIRKKQSNAVSALLLVFSFVTVFLADVVYMVTFFNPQRELLWSVYFSEFSYTIFIALFVAFIVIHFRKRIANGPSLFITASAFVSFLVVNFKFILIPFFHRTPAPNAFYVVNSTVYALLETLVAAIALPLALRASTWRTSTFFTLILMLFVGGFGIRYQTVLVQQATLMGFEYAWQTVMAGMAVLFACGKSLPENTPEALPGYYSIRAILSIAVTAVLFFLFFVLIATGLLGLGSAFQLTNILLVWFFVFTGGNFLALYVSRQIVTAPAAALRQMKMVENSEIINARFEEIVPRKYELFELQQIVGEFNRLAVYLNRTLDFAREQSKYAAIANTTQMVAHDVRRPFSMMQATIDMLKKVRTVEEMHLVVNTASRDIERAVISVSGLLTDIMEIGSKHEPHKEATRVDSLVKSSLMACFEAHPVRDIRISHQFGHKQNVFIDTNQTLRVFLNIISNAIQALQSAQSPNAGCKGEIWIETADVLENGMPFVLFRVGNNGPKVPAENVPNLFETFFTHGKKGGTGLGLAIAQKVVNSHGGRIWYNDAMDRGLEFCFTLPGSSEFSGVPQTQIPVESGEILDESDLHRKDKVLLSSSTNSMTPGLIRDLLVPLKRTLRIHIVDDEPLYRNAVSHTLGDSLHSFVTLYTHKNAEELWAATKVDQPDLLVLDVDLGETSLSGFEIAAEIRRRGMTSFVCIHTNRVLSADNRAALEAGADAFLPKPLSEQHFLKLLAQAIERAVSSVRPMSDVKNVLDAIDVRDVRDVRDVSGDRNVSGSKDRELRFAVVDDDAVVLMAWEFEDADYPCDTYSSPEDFLNRVSQDKGYAETITAVVTDFYFDNSEMSGIRFAQKIKEICPALDVYLSTNATLTLAEAGDCIKGVLAKNSKKALAVLINSYSKNKEA